MLTLRAVAATLTLFVALEGIDPAQALEPEGSAGAFAAADVGSTAAARANFAAGRASLAAKPSAVNGATAQGAARSPVYNVKDYGIGVGAGNAAIDTRAVEAASAAMAETGGTLYFPGSAMPYQILPGRITLSVISPASPGMRFRILGDGPLTSKLYCGSAAGICLSYRGGVSGSNAHESYLDISNIGFFGPNPAKDSVGISVNSAAFLTLTNILVSGFDVGFDGTDIEISKVESSRFRYNKKGFRCQAHVVTGCNNISLDSTTISNNAEWGAYFRTGYALFCNNCDIEYNGMGQGDDSWGLRMDNFGDVNGPALNVVNGIFEGNSGAADVWINANHSPYGSNYTFIGTGFMKISDSRYVKNHILLSGNQPANVITINSAFSSSGNYKASASNKVWKNTNRNGEIYNIGNFDTFANPLETPDNYLTDNMLSANSGSFAKNVEAGSFSTTGSQGVSCAAGVARSSTMVVDHGIITHC